MNRPVRDKKALFKRSVNADGPAKKRSRVMCWRKPTKTTGTWTQSEKPKMRRRRPSRTSERPRRLKGEAHAKSGAQPENEEEVELRVCSGRAAEEEARGLRRYHPEVEGWRILSDLPLLPRNKAPTRCLKWQTT